MLLERDASLFFVGRQIDLTHPELDVQVGYSLIEDISGQSRLDQVIPYILWVKMQVLAETPGNDCPACELITKFRWYG
jgi:hypothetical protein